MILEHIGLFATATAAASAWAAVRTGRKMQFEGVGIQDGGGYAAILLTAVVIHIAAVSVAIS